MEPFIDFSPFYKYFKEFEPYFCSSDWKLLNETIKCYKQEKHSLANDIKHYYNRKIKKIKAHDIFHAKQCFLIAKVQLVASMLERCREDIIFLSGFTEGKSTLCLLPKELGRHIIQLKYPFLIDSEEFIRNHFCRKIANPLYTYANDNCKIQIDYHVVSTDDGFPLPYDEEEKNKCCCSLL